MTFLFSCFIFSKLILDKISCSIFFLFSLSLNNLIDLYLSDNEVMMNLRTGFNLDQLDKHAEEAAKKIGL